MLSWQPTGDGQNRAQTAFQVIVKDRSGAVAWDSKKQVSSSNQTTVAVKLAPSTPYTWCCTLWDEGDRVGIASPEASFTTALDDWASTASWMGRPLGQVTAAGSGARPAPYWNRCQWVWTSTTPTKGTETNRTGTLTQTPDHNPHARRDGCPHQALHSPALNDCRPRRLARHCGPGLHLPGQRPARRKWGPLGLTTARQRSPSALPRGRQHGGDHCDGWGHRRDHGETRDRTLRRCLNVKLEFRRMYHPALTPCRSRRYQARRWSCRWTRAGLRPRMVPQRRWSSWHASARPRIRAYAPPWLRKSSTRARGASQARARVGSPPSSCRRPPSSGPH